MELEFIKYQGAGNDFVLVDGRCGGVSFSKEQVAAICHRRFGVGADGLMILESGGQDEGVDFTMRYYNSDGGESTMCGNGGRCIVRYADDLGIGGARKRFVAVDGEHTAVVCGGGIRLSMNSVERVHAVEEGWVLDTGSPHVVVEGGYDPVVARRLRQKYDANVNFVEGVLGDKITIKTYERGVEDMTYACGTGAVAAAVVMARGGVGGAQRWMVESPGGVLEVQFNTTEGGESTDVVLSGGAERVFSGKLVI